jgi:hypothetical protein
MQTCIIGLGYRAGSGKDTVGDYLVERYGFKRVSFGDVVRRTVEGMLNLYEDGGEENNVYSPEFKTAPTRLGITGGQMLQRVGMGMRQALGDDIWVKLSDLTLHARLAKRIVITDVRFQNEAAEIKRLGGVLWEVYRPGIAQDDHVSETSGAHIKWDRQIYNGGTLAELATNVDTELNSSRPWWDGPLPPASGRDTPLPPRARAPRAST